MQPVLRLDQVTKRFGSTTALEDVSLTVPRGVVFALLGENGAGKTTALRVLLGLERATSGRAEVSGLNSLRRGREIRRRVGYVPERPTLYEWMTVQEMGWFTAGFYGDGYLESYLRLSDDFGLPRRRQLKVLSKGMRAKVALSLAMAHHPELLILDEPTSGLDTMVRREFLESMVDVAAAGRTVLLSSHQINDVERVADWVAMLHQGRVVLVETLDRLKQTTRELTVTVVDASREPPPVRGEVLRRRRRARQWQILVRADTEPNTADIELDDAVLTVDVRTPALEEIFVAYMQGASEQSCYEDVCERQEVQPT